MSDFGLASFMEEEEIVLRAELEEAIFEQLCLLLSFDGLKTH